MTQKITTGDIAASGSQIAIGSGNVQIAGGDRAQADPPAAPAIVLAVFASPSGQAPVSWERDLRVLHDCLAPYPARFRLEILPQATPDDLHRALLRLQPQHLHIVGHGSLEGLVLQDASGDSYIVSGLALQSALAGTPALECVILSACHSADFAQGGQLRADLVVMRDEISAEGAQFFARGFYDALAARDAVPVAEAYRAGITRLQLYGSADADRPVLLPGAAL
jgi:hypothetical protein